MTVADLIEVLRQCETQTAVVRVRVYESGRDVPLLSSCDVQDVTDIGESIVIDVEEV